jgi:taurine dioxygenase
VRNHTLLVFKDQGVVGHERQLEISRWFGEIESTFFDHPKSPHRDIFRVSNDRSEG